MTAPPAGGRGAAISGPEWKPRLAGSAAVVTMGADGRIREFSDAAVEVFGFSREEAIGAELAELIIPPRLRAAHRTGLSRLSDRGTGPIIDNRFRMPALHRDGSEFEIELVVTRISCRGDTAYAAFIRRIQEPAVVPGELFQRAEFFRALVEEAPIEVGLLDDSGVLVWQSRTGLANSGDRRGRHADELIAELVHPSDLDRARALLRRAVESGISDPATVRVRAVDGAWREMSLLARVLSREPALSGVAFYLVDHTVARAAERLEATRLRTLIQSLSVGVILQDPDRRVVVTNAALTDMFGIEGGPAALEGSASEENYRRYRHLMADPDDAHKLFEEILHRGEPVRDRETVLNNHRVLSSDYTPISADGNVVGHLWMYRDVTAQADRNRALQERNAVLAEVARLRRDFVSIMSHELRTPLTSIATFTEMLPEADGECIAAIRRNTERLLVLVDDMLELARLEAAESPAVRVPVDLAELLCEAGVAGGAHPEIEAGPALDGDPAMLRELFDTVVAVIGAVGAAVTVRAAADATAWRVLVLAGSSAPVTIERLLSTRLPHPHKEDEHRTGAFALLLARAMAARHGGELHTDIGSGSVAVTVSLPFPAAAPVSHPRRTAGAARHDQPS